MPDENETREQAAIEAEIAEREAAFAARLPPEAFEAIALALGGDASLSSLKALRELLLQDLYSFFLSRAPADKRTQARNARLSQLKKRSKAAAALLASLKRGSILDCPRMLLEEPFRTKFMSILEGWANPASITRERHKPNEAFRSDLVPGLIWAYEHITGEKAKKPHWLPDSRAYGGAFYLFACAVRRCLWDRLPEVQEALSNTDDALAQELRKHWPKGDTETG